MMTLEDRYLARVRQFKYRGYTIIATCTRDEEGFEFFPVVDIYRGRKFLKSRTLSVALTSPTQNFKMEERAGKQLITSILEK